MDGSGRIGGHVSRLVHMQTGLAHPWMNHFQDAYPDKAQPRIAELRDQIMKSRSLKARRMTTQ